MKAWRVKRFLVEEINYKKSDVDSKPCNTFFTKEEAYKYAIKNVSETVDSNLDYREKLLSKIEEQESVLLYYIKKRNQLILEAKSENIVIDDVIL
jgi:hypothetical protein